MIQIVGVAVIAVGIFSAVIASIYFAFDWLTWVYEIFDDFFYVPD